MPISTPPPTSQQTTLDKTSVIRLSVANLKCRDVITRVLRNPVIKDELKYEVDLLSCLDGFNIVLGSNLDIVYVSENVNNFIGLTQVNI